jgi:hypothetical protein
LDSRGRPFRWLDAVTEIVERIEREAVADLAVLVGEGSFRRKIYPTAICKLQLKADG